MGRESDGGGGGDRKQFRWLSLGQVTELCIAPRCDTTISIRVADFNLVAFSIREFVFCSLHFLLTSCSETSGT